MQDVLKTFLLAIVGAAGVSTWKLIKKHWRVLTFLCVGVVTVLFISVVVPVAPVFPPSVVHGPGAASVIVSGAITITIRGDTTICSADGQSWSAQGIELKPHIVTMVCMAS